MDLGAVMDEVAAQLATIPKLRVYAWPADNVQPPAAVVTYPDVIYDETMRRGMDRYPDLSVVVLVAKPWDRSARDQISVYLDGGGDRSIKTVVEAGEYTSLDSVRVTGAEVDAVKMAGVEYLAATFMLDVAGPGDPQGGP